MDTKAALRKAFPTVATAEQAGGPKRVKAEQILALLEKFMQLYKLSLDDLKNEWEVYALTKNINMTDVSLPHLNKLGWALDTTHAAKRPATDDVMDLDKDSIKGNSFRERFNITAKGPASPIKSKKRTRDQIETLEAVLRSGTAPAPRILTSQYAQRSDSGKVVVSYQPALSIDSSASRPSHRELVFTVESSCGTLERLPFMHDSPQMRAKTINDRIEQIGKQLLTKSKLEETKAFNLPSQGTTVAVAMIQAEDESRLHDQGTFLQKDNIRVKVDLARKAEYTFFPGQVVVISGLNSQGVRILPDIVHTDVTLPGATLTSNEVQARAKPLRVMAAAGPFTFNDDTEYVPFVDLLKKAQTHKPDALFLYGPFVDAHHPYISGCQVTVTYEELFAVLIEKITTHLPASSGVLVCLIPSIRDVHHDMVFPQPPFDAETDLPDNVQMLPNPSVFRINGVSFGVTSVDVILHLSQQIITKSPDTTAECVSALIQQQSIYPLHPPARNEVNLSIAHSELLALPYTPDVLLLPSTTAAFVKTTGNVLSVNPNRLCGEQGGGTYAELDITASTDPTKPIVERASVRVIKI